MTPLKNAVLHHKLDVISAIASSPEIASYGLDIRFEMLRLAESMGNVMTMVRVARVFPEVVSTEQARLYLRKCLAAISSNYFGGGSLEVAARRAWMQIIGRGGKTISKEEPDFILSSEQLADLRFLFERLGLASESDVVSLVRDDA